MELLREPTRNWPHIDWYCTQCGSVYCSSGPPKDNRCIEGHSTSWEPELLDDYIELAQSLEAGDEVIVCSHTTVPLVGTVNRAKDTFLEFEEHSDVVWGLLQWGIDKETLKLGRTDRERVFWTDVWHLEKQ